jgi:hypothetical protein
MVVWISKLLEVLALLISRFQTFVAGVFIDVRFSLFFCDMQSNKAVIVLKLSVNVSDRQE